MAAHSRRIEIVGVAGTGKSTLAGTLLERHPDWRLAEFIRAREPGDWSSFVHCAPRTVRLLAQAFPHRPPSWDEVKAFVYASEWHRRVEAQPEPDARVTLFDQGPVYAIARLLWGGSAVTRSSWFESWKRETAARSALELDVVVELTAADDVLLARIDAREKSHAAKGTSSRAALELLAAHRRAYDDVLGELEQAGHARLVRLDTSERRPEALADEVSRILFPHDATALDGPGADAHSARGAALAAMREGMQEVRSSR